MKKKRPPKSTDKAVEPRALKRALTKGQKRNRVADSRKDARYG